MTPAIHPLYHREDAQLGLTPASGPAPAQAYLSMLWMMQMVIRLIVRTRFAVCPPRYFEVENTVRVTQNRTLRRAKAACMRRAIRDRARGRTFDPSRYMPRFFNICAALATAPDGLTPGQFKNHYARESGLGRVRVFGLSGAHEMAIFIPADIKAPSAQNSGGARANAAAQNSDAQTGPAPP